MKILRINKFHWPKGGADIYYLHLNKLLEQQGHEVIHFAMQHPNNEPSKYADYFVSQTDFSKITFSWQGLKSLGKMLYSFEAARKIDKLIRDTQPDVVHIHNIYHQISPSILRVIKKHKLPVVMTAHDFKLMCTTYSMVAKDAPCERCKKHKYYMPLVMRCNKNSLLASLVSALEITFHKIFRMYKKNIDRYIAPSAFQKQKLVEWGYPEDMITHVPHYIDVQSFAAAAQPSQGYFLYFGRLHPTKGVHWLLQAMRQLPKDYTLKIVGTGEQETALQAMVQRLGLTNVQFLGELKGNSLYDVVGRSLAVVAPSVMYEVFGQTVAQAMSAGKPVIGTDNGGIAELIEHGIDGMLFPTRDIRKLAECMRYIAEHKDEAEQMGKRAQVKILEKHNAEKHVDAIVGIYTSLV